MSFGVWPSRGLSIIGFEVKVNRSDWLSELKNPEKAESMVVHCNEWYVVAPEDVIKPEEVPPNWGYYLATKRGLKLVKEAVYNTELNGPVDRVFIMSVVRNISRNYVPQKKLKELVKAGVDNHKNTWYNDHEGEKERHKVLKKKVEEFEIASGFKLSNWGTSPASLGKLINYLVSYGFEGDYTNAVDKANDLGKALEAFTSVELFKWVKEKREENRNAKSNSI